MRQPRFLVVRPPKGPALRLLVLLLLCAAALNIQSESITLTTAYPSPAGIYRQLITTGGTAANPSNTILARDAGNVGIGITNPEARLHVEDGMFLRGGSGDVTGDGQLVPLDVLRIINHLNANGGSGLSPGERARADINGDGRANGLDVALLTDVLNGSRSVAQAQDFGKAVADRAISMDLSGNVGIGVSDPVHKLDVLGGVRVGSQAQATTCNAGSAGTLRYNTTSTSMEFCNGSAWSPMGSRTAFIAPQNIAAGGGWTTHNLSFLPAGATTAILEGIIQSSDSLCQLRVRRDESSADYLLVGHEDGGDDGWAGAQGMVPLTSGRTFQSARTCGNASIRVIGYIQ